MKLPWSESWQEWCTFDYNLTQREIDRREKLMKKDMYNDVWGWNQLMVISAFRYCLGRQTYIVGTCADWLILQWDNFTNETKDLIKRELEEAFTAHNAAVCSKSDYRPLGAPCDVREWERVRALWLPKTEQEEV